MSGGTFPPYPASLWEYIILGLVLISTCVLGAYDYSDRENETSRNKALDAVTYVLMSLFFLEAAVKIVALGIFSHQLSYFRNPWNIFDFAILVILYKRGGKEIYK
ncbi:MAG: ion transporter [Candidatus Pacebacteria bacterium]|nr:ion transporter [Candidatus Paceibacterota bacterium]